MGRGGGFCPRRRSSSVLSLRRDMCRQQWRLRPDVQGHGHGRAVQLPRGIHPAARRENVQRSAQSRGQCPPPLLGHCRAGGAGPAMPAGGWAWARRLSCRLHVWVGAERREAQHPRPHGSQGMLFHRAPPGSRAQKQGSPSRTGLPA